MSVQKDFSAVTIQIPETCLHSFVFSSSVSSQSSHILWKSCTGCPPPKWSCTVRGASTSGLSYLEKAWCPCSARLWVLWLLNALPARPLEGYLFGRSVVRTLSGASGCFSAWNKCLWLHGITGCLCAKFRPAKCSCSNQYGETIRRTQVRQVFILNPNAIALLQNTSLNIGPVSWHY